MQCAAEQGHCQRAAERQGACIMMLLCSSGAKCKRRSLVTEGCAAGCGHTADAVPHGRGHPEPGQ